MGFLQSKEAVRGYQRQDELVPLIEAILKSKGHDCKVKPGTLKEDMKDHVDAKIYCGENPFMGYYTIPIDIKTGRTFTIYSHTGINNLDATKSVYLVYEKAESDDYLLFIKVSKLRELVQKHNPRLHPGKYDNSKYFWILDFVEDHSDEFEDHEYFIYSK